MTLNEILFTSLGVFEDIADEPLTFQQMFLELNSILVMLNQKKINRDAFLLYLANSGYITLKSFSDQKLGIGYLVIKNQMDIKEAYVTSAYGIQYYTLLFGKEARIEIYRNIEFYYNFVLTHAIQGIKLKGDEILMLEKLVEENRTIQAICLDLARKPMVIYEALRKYKFKPREDPKAWRKR